LIGLVSSEALRPRMAGIGLRYTELARQLAAAGHRVLALSPALEEEAAELELGPAVDYRRFALDSLRQRLSGCACIVTQGQLANDVLLAASEVPTAIDLYDPWLVENLHYTPTLGLDPYRNDHATWVLQMTRGDFFLCSSEEQRLFYLGFLSAVGRVNPSIVAADPALERLIAVVPFGVPARLPEHRPYLPAPRPGERRILFGALYDWYDPITLLEALTEIDDRWRLLLVRTPNPEGTPQRLLGEVEAWCRRRGWWGERVETIDWVPAERRYDLLRDVDLLATTHAPSLETALAMRTRYLDALAAGCPVLLSDGGATARIVREAGAGWVVAPGDRAATAAALREALAPGAERERRIAAGRRAAERFTWARALAPLLAFCAAPRRDASKERFVAAPPTVAPPDALAFRVRRFVRGLGSRS
jgi:glycosyltransferase involved in cell wall biosynthesis